ncbi:MAG: PAS domain-containing protein, partial [Proteobacteria bacterium]|nr:PAS domain-containing protein [Pseudomonadota bacterium]
MRHQGTKHIFAYWQRLKGRRIAAERADFNPGDVGRFLADVILLEQSGAGRWTFRIAGSR